MRPEKQPQGRPKKPTMLGNDIALTLPVGGAAFNVSYWDLWFALVAARDFGGDLDAVFKKVGAVDRSTYFDRNSTERKRSHIRDFQKRLRSAGLTIGEVVKNFGAAAKSEILRARRRVSEPNERQREWSPAMHRTPRIIGRERALRGWWPQFPVSPDAFAEELRAKFQWDDFYTERQSFDVGRKLGRWLEKANKMLTAGRAAEAQSLLRAWMTVIVELMESVDDSCGVVGDTFGEGFEAYLKIDIVDTRIAEETYFPDLLTFLVWENYGLTFKKFDGYFERLSSEQANVCIRHLRAELDQLRSDGLDYQAEAALNLLIQVVAEQEQFGMFEAYAREAGCGHWTPILLLADRAVKRGQRDLAKKVLGSALAEGGLHMDLVSRKYEQLKRGKWSIDPRT